ncbi:hypothetical protein B0I35DRAFT_416681 [Stachybotrys elegans]|uniref:Uncharacterized protein n=1 Tax=Stachybotrys elegans TaxID=80388 RepID=A0A8K0T090_9HYPO|nr:hypothetical protein B0I35DRAFT_416681 [Stachybotrys elegans]
MRPDLVQGPFGPELNFTEPSADAMSSQAARTMDHMQALPMRPRPAMLPRAASSDSSSDSSNEGWGERQVQQDTETRTNPPQDEMVGSWTANNTEAFLSERFSNREAYRRYELSRLHSIRFELSTGDTLVFIDYDVPPRKYTDCSGVAYSSQELRVSSTKLLATGSSKFADMLKPTYQFRVQRRRGLVNKLPEGVKYVLDLTPASEGDELVFQMTELSLTPGVINWWRVSKNLEVQEGTVGGHDDICSCLLEPFRDQPPTSSESNVANTNSTQEARDKPEESIASGSKAIAIGQEDTEMGDNMDQAEPSIPAPTSSSWKRELTLAKGIKELLDYDNSQSTEAARPEPVRAANKADETPEYRQIPDYCPVRHRTCIIRLLMLIEGKHISLDSATRMWTIVALAKIFDCRSVVRDLVLQWIMDSHNTKFIEVLPEEAIRIGYALELPFVTQPAFRILVNEFAIKEAATSPDPKAKGYVTVFGRKVGDPGDEMSNLIQHAARDFIERISAPIEILRRPDIFEYWDLQEWKKVKEVKEILMNHTHLPMATPVLEKVQLLMETLSHHVRLTFDGVAREVAPETRDFFSIDRDRRSYVDPADFEMLVDIMSRFNPTQKLLCPAIYEELSTQFRFIFRPWKSSRFSANWGMRFGTIVKEATATLRDFFKHYPSVPRPANWLLLTDVIDLDKLSTEIHTQIEMLSVITVRDMWDPPLNLTRHMLLTLSNEEMKYLPLWAGGCDDGTGGVFEAFLPPADMGPIEPGPMYHTGYTVPSAASSSTGSLTADLRDLRVAGSSTAGSIDVHDSISTVYRSDRIIVDDESIASEAFTASESDYQDARFQVPANAWFQPVGLEMVCNENEPHTAQSRSDDADLEMYMQQDSDDDTQTVMSWNDSDFEDEIDLDQL